MVYLDDFPSLVKLCHNKRHCKIDYGDQQTWFTAGAINQTCIDKTKVKDALEYFFGTPHEKDMCGAYGTPCYHCLLRERLNL